MNPFSSLEDLFNAAIFAARKHQGQVRKDRRASPYVTHPLAVARTIYEIGGINDRDTLVAAILHDTLEDTQTTPDDIREIFGGDVVSIVLEVTDDKTQIKMERKRQQVIHAEHLSQAARVIKLADKLINCRDIINHPPDDWPLSRRRDYIQWAADVISRVRGTNPQLEDAFDRMLSDAEAKLEFKIEPYETVGNRPWAPY